MLVTAQHLTTLSLSLKVAAFMLAVFHPTELTWLRLYSVNQNRLYVHAPLYSFVVRVQSRSLCSSANNLFDLVCLSLSIKLQVQAVQMAGSLLGQSHLFMFIKYKRIPKYSKATII